MKVSLNWVRQFTDITLSTEELVQKIGEQLGAVEEVVDFGAKYQSIHIVEVIKCEKHPNADKLTVCQIDDGGVNKSVMRNDNGYIDVVCGAPNVRAGMMAVWLPPGATVPATSDKEPFVLDARELRGVKSNGMLASASELAIGEDHTGIVEVDIPASPGDDFAETYELNDVVIDIENKMFTHRPDCFGILGVAREIAGICGKPFISPKWYLRQIEGLDKTKQTSLAVRNNIPELVPRFMAVVLDDIQVKQSPLIIRSYLSRVGIRPINNIVDATNYVMAITGQPLHAYDADKLQALTNQEALQLEARLSRKGDSLKLLDGNTVAFTDEATILVTSHDIPVGVGGIMGGADTEVDESTKRIILECANFDMYAIRRASMRHGLFTEAVTRFNKGQSPHQNDRVLSETIAMIELVSGALRASDICDEKSSLAPPEPIEVSPEFISKRLGLSIGADKIKSILENVEFKVHKTADNLKIDIPFWRMDIKIPEDIVEEVGRLVGYDSLPLELPRKTVAPVRRNHTIDFKYRIRDTLTAAGGNEVLTYSFVHEKLLTAAGQDPADAFRLTNALSPDLQYYRLSLAPSLLDKVHANVKAGFSPFVLFEIGKVHQKTVMDEAESSVPAEHDRLALVFAANNKDWEENFAGSAFYQARAYLDNLMKQLGVPFTIQPIDSTAGDKATAMEALFDKNRSGHIVVNDAVAGVIGEPQALTRNKLKLPLSVAVIELDIALLQTNSEARGYVALARYPKIQQDISLKVAGSVAYAELQAIVQSAVEGSESDARWIVEPLDIYVPENDMSTKHVAFRISAWPTSQTMTNKAFTAVLETVATAANEEFDAIRL